VELRLLGPVEIHAGGTSLALGVPQRRAVLAALAVDVGRIVLRQTLIDRVLDDAPPSRVESAVPRRQLGRYLRELRGNAQMAPRQAAAALEISASTLQQSIDRREYVGHSKTS
jgi:hypothetical protein